MPPIAPESICFGLDHQHDVSSLAIFLQLLGRAGFVEIFTARLSSTEISQLVATCTELMRRHLTEKEYHQLFLGQQDAARSIMLPENRS